MNGNGSILSKALSAAIMGVIFLTVLILVVFSAGSYRNSVDTQHSNFETRAAVGYVLTAVKANKTDDIYLDGSGNSAMLVISDSISGLEQHIYSRGGDLIENYGPAGGSFVADGEEIIGHPGRFEMSMDGDSLLRISTDYGDSYVNIRNLE